MTGRYVVYTPALSLPDEKCFDAAWSRIVSICRSLHGDRLRYRVQLNLTDCRPHVLITASGKAAPRRKPVLRRMLPPVVPPQHCRDRAQEAKWFLPEYRAERKDGADYWSRHRARYRELSELTQELLRAEIDYWLELESLTRQRQHYKPGLTAESIYLDDEVAA